MAEKQIDTALNEFEQERKKIEIALEITDGDLEKAKKLVSGEIKDIAVIKCRFVENDVKLYGAFILFINLENKLIERCFTLITFDAAVLKNTPYGRWTDFENNIIDIQWKGKNLATQSQELKSNIESAFAFEYIGMIVELLQSDNEKKIIEILKKIIIQTLDLETIKIELGIEFINRFFMKYESKDISQKSAKEEEKPDEEKKEESYIKEGEILLEGELAISPIRGINITKLEPEMEILVRLFDKTAQEKYFINVLNAYDGKKIIPVKAIVRYVSYDETYGYLVIAELGPGIVVKCIEKAQINIMTPEIAEKEKKSRFWKLILIICGALLLLFIGLFIFLSLKGVI